MDGLFDPASQKWSETADASWPVRLSVSKQALCPKCAENFRFELLRLAPTTAVWMCKRGHQFQETALGG